MVIRSNTVNNNDVYFNQSTRSAGGWPIVNVGWENGSERGLKIVSFNP